MFFLRKFRRTESVYIPGKLCKPYCQSIKLFNVYQRMCAYRRSEWHRKHPNTLLVPLSILAESWDSVKNVTSHGSIQNLTYGASTVVSIDQYLVGFWICAENFGIVKEKPTRKTCFSREKKCLAPCIYQAKFCLALFLRSQRNLYYIFAKNRC